MAYLFPSAIAALLLLAGILILHAVAYRPALFGRTLFGAATGTAGLIVGGFTFFHEYLLGCALAGQLRSLAAARPAADRRIRRHLFVFAAMCAYFALESVRGMLVLRSPQKIRWVVFYAILAALAVLAVRSRELLPRGERLAGLVARTGAVYFTAYLLWGAVAELVFGVSRYDLQPGHVHESFGLWGSSAYAIFPVVVVVPSAVIAVRSASRRARRGGWLALAAAVVAVLYYDSRSGLVALAVYAVVALRRLGILRLALLLGLAAGVIAALMAWVWLPGRDWNAFTEDILSSGNSLWSRNTAPGGGHDFYRAVTIEAAFRTIRTDAVHLLFGYGMRVSGFVIGPAVTEMYQGYDSQRLVGDSARLGLEAFPDLVVNTGVCGLALLALNSWLLIVGAARQRGSRNRVLAAAAVLAANAWLSVINISDVPLFYIALMPCGILAQLAREERA